MAQMDHDPLLSRAPMKSYGTPGADSGSPPVRPSQAHAAPPDLVPRLLLAAAAAATYPACDGTSFCLLVACGVLLCLLRLPAVRSALPYLAVVPLASAVLEFTWGAGGRRLPAYQRYAPEGALCLALLVDKIAPWASFYYELAPAGISRIVLCLFLPAVSAASGPSGLSLPFLLLFVLRLARVAKQDPVGSRTDTRTGLREASGWRLFCVPWTLFRFSPFWGFAMLVVSSAHCLAAAEREIGGLDGTWAAAYQLLIGPLFTSDDASPSVVAVHLFSTALIMAGFAEEAPKADQPERVSSPLSPVHPHMLSPPTLTVSRASPDGEVWVAAEAAEAWRLSRRQPLQQPGKGKPRGVQPSVAEWPFDWRSVLLYCLIASSAAYAAVVPGLIGFVLLVAAFWTVNMRWSAWGVGVLLCTSCALLIEQFLAAMLASIHVSSPLTLPSDSLASSLQNFALFALAAAAAFLSGATPSLPAAPPPAAPAPQGLAPLPTDEETGTSPASSADGKALKSALNRRPHTDPKGPNANPGSPRGLVPPLPLDLPRPVVNRGNLRSKRPRFVERAAESVLSDGNATTAALSDDTKAAAPWSPMSAGTAATAQPAQPVHPDHPQMLPFGTVPRKLVRFGFFAVMASLAFAYPDLPNLVLLIAVWLVASARYTFRSHWGSLIVVTELVILCRYFQARVDVNGWNSYFEPLLGHGSGPDEFLLSIGGLCLATTHGGKMRSLDLMEKRLRWCDEHGRVVCLIALANTLFLTPKHSCLLLAAVVVVAWGGLVVASGTNEAQQRFMSLATALTCAVSVALFLVRSPALLPFPGARHWLRWLLLETYPSANPTLDITKQTDSIIAGTSYAWAAAATAFAYQHNRYRFDAVSIPMARAVLMTGVVMPSILLVVSLFGVRPHFNFSHGSALLPYLLLVPLALLPESAVVGAALVVLVLENPLRGTVAGGVYFLLCLCTALARFSSLSWFMTGRGTSGIKAFVEYLALDVAVPVFFLVHLALFPTRSSWLQVPVGDAWNQLLSPVTHPGESELQALYSFRDLYPHLAVLLTALGERWTWERKTRAGAAVGEIVDPVRLFSVAYESLLVLLLLSVLTDKSVSAAATLLAAALLCYLGKMEVSRHEVWAFVLFIGSLAFSMASYFTPAASLYVTDVTLHSLLTLAAAVVGAANRAIPPEVFTAAPYPKVFPLSNNLRYFDEGFTTHLWKYRKAIDCIRKPRLWRKEAGLRKLLLVEEQPDEEEGGEDNESSERQKLAKSHASVATADYSGGGRQGHWRRKESTNFFDASLATPSSVPSSVTDLLTPRSAFAAESDRAVYLLLVPYFLLLLIFVDGVMQADLPDGTLVPMTLAQIARIAFASTVIGSIDVVVWRGNHHWKWSYRLYFAILLSCIATYLLTCDPAVSAKLARAVHDSAAPSNVTDLFPGDQLLPLAPSLVVASFFSCLLAPCLPSAYPPFWGLPTLLALLMMMVLWKWGRVMDGRGWGRTLFAVYKEHVASKEEGKRITFERRDRLELAHKKVEQEKENRVKALKELRTKRKGMEFRASHTGQQPAPPVQMSLGGSMKSVDDDEGHSGLTFTWSYKPVTRAEMMSWLYNDGWFAAHLRFVSRIVWSMTAELVYVLIALHFVANPSLSTLFPLLSVFLYALLAAPLPIKGYWKALLLYYRSLIVLKSVFFWLILDRASAPSVNARNVLSLVLGWRATLRANIGLSLWQFIGWDFFLTLALLTHKYALTHIWGLWGNKGARLERLCRIERKDKSQPAFPGSANLAASWRSPASPHAAHKAPHPREKPKAEPDEETPPDTSSELADSGGWGAAVAREAEVVEKDARHPRDSRHRLSSSKGAQYLSPFPARERHADPPRAAAAGAAPLNEYGLEASAYGGVKVAKRITLGGAAVQAGHQPVPTDGVPVPSWLNISGRKIWRNLFNNASKPGADVYSPAFVTDLTAWFVFLVGYSDIMGSNEGIAENIQNNLIPGALVFSLFALFLVLVVDRITYLSRSLIAKTVLHGLLSLFYLCFYLDWSFSYVEKFREVGLSKGSAPNQWRSTTSFDPPLALQAFMVLKILYLVASALQVRHGFADKVQPHFFSGRYSPVWSFLYTVYRSIPFLFEFRVLLDWTVTRTSLKLAYWFKLEDIMHQIHLCLIDKADTKRLQKQLDTQRTRAYPLSYKCTSGVGMLVALIVVLFFPLVYYSSLGPDLTDNYIEEAVMQVSLSSGRFAFGTIYTGRYLVPDLRAKLAELHDIGKGLKLPVEWTKALESTRPSLTGFGLAWNSTRTVQMLPFFYGKIDVLLHKPQVSQLVSLIDNYADGPTSAMDEVTLVMDLSVKRTSAQNNKQWLTGRQSRTLDVSELTVLKRQLQASAIASNVEHSFGIPEEDALALPSMLSPFEFNKNLEMTFYRSRWGAKGIHNKVGCSMRSYRQQGNNWWNMTCDTLFTHGNPPSVADLKGFGSFNFTTRETNCLRGITSACIVLGYDRESSNEQAHSGPYFVAISDLVPNGSGVLPTSLGVVALYTTFVLAVGNVLRASLMGQAARVSLTDLEAPEALNTLIYHIQMAR
eukprot:gene5968-9163_t